MLVNLYIQNIALIDNLSIDFEPRLNVFSGETGAGKSIIIDSLNFVLGAKSSKNLIKQGKDFMKVVATFSSPFSSEFLSKLKEFDIEQEDEIILSRKLTLDGKSEIKINGQPLTISMLKVLSSLLVDIHGQHEHQRLLSQASHQGIVDGFIKDKKIFETYTCLYSTLKDINSKINGLYGSTQNQERVLDLLSYQIGEIERAELKENEDEILSQKKEIMQNSEKIYENLSSAYSEIDSTSLIDNIKSATSHINAISKFDDALSAIAERLDSAKYELMDIAQTLKDKRDETTFDKYDFEKIDTRLDLIKTLKKKYGPTLDDVFSFLQKAKKDFDEISNSKEKLEKLTLEKEDLLHKIYDCAKNISNIRQDIARKFEEKVKKELGDLGMKNSSFVVSFGDFPQFEECEKRLTTSGMDDIRFMFSANAGQNMKPLSEIISGGEASRFMLALKNILADSDNISLMVFDEIDTGISGEMGYKVACKLANISNSHQVMSVSHLPQICAMADNNILVAKEVKDAQTFVSTKTLNNDEKLLEISRLSGGEANSSASILHAKYLKEKCDEYKNSIK